MIRMTISNNDKRGSSSSSSPNRVIHKLGGSPPKKISSFKNQGSQPQPTPQLQKKYSSNKLEEAILPQEYRQALDENDRLRQQLYGLLADLPNYVTTKSIGISKYQRDNTIEQTSKRLTTIANNQDTIVKYQSFSQKLKQQLKTIGQVRSINKKISQTYSSNILDRQL